MKKAFFCTVLILTFLPNFVFGQSNKDILFSVAGKPVEVEEFEYIYKKTNGPQATYSRESLEEYLDLYIKFKLKVQRARDMQLDTIMALSRELEDYRRQLADTYLVDKEVTDKLVVELYERMQIEREVAHILFKFKPNANAKDSAEVKDRAARVMEILRKGGDFDRMAVGQSDDQNAKETKGNIGYLSAMLPNGFYSLENAIYHTPIGKVSEIVESPMGLHIVKVLNERPARGEMEVAHILIRDSENSPIKDAEQRIIQIWTQLNDGASFETLANEYSEDLTSASKGGHLGFFGINRYEQSFEDAAFSLTMDGTYTNPVKTRIGWHIIKRISHKGIDQLPKIKNRLQGQIKQDQRFERSKRNMISKIQEDAEFNENPEVLQQYIKTLDNEFLSYKWKGSEIPTQTMFALKNDMAINTDDFNEFLLRNQRKRLQMSRDSNVYETATILYQEFIDESMIKYAERKLEVKYPEFKALMREYEEGILLFEAAKLLIWDKASQDTIGLTAFHKKNNSRYMWDERAQIADYKIKTTNSKLADKIYKFASKKSSDKVLKKFNKKEEIVTVEFKTVEKTNTKMLGELNWNANSITALKSIDQSPNYTFSKVEKIIPSKPKTLNESRGPAIADYQDHLEKEWIDELRSKYSVEVNHKVLDRMILK
jgi:peptidyl-prolyl cis-trans isomerase SurA